MIVWGELKTDGQGKSGEAASSISSLLPRFPTQLSRSSSMKSSSSQRFWLGSSSFSLGSSCGFSSENKESNSGLLDSEVKFRLGLGSSSGKTEIVENEAQASMSPSLEGPAMRQWVWVPSCVVERGVSSSQGNVMYACELKEEQAREASCNLFLSSSSYCTIKSLAT